MRPLNVALMDNTAELQHLVEETMRKHGVVRARLFGSASRDELTPESDVDFLVEFEPGRSLLDLSGLRLDLSDLLRRDVDVATPASLHPKLADQIEREAVELF